MNDAGLFLSSAQFANFKEFAPRVLNLSKDKETSLGKAKNYVELCTLCSSLGLSEENLTRCLSEFCHWTYLSFIDPRAVKGEILPLAFCRSNGVAPVKDEKGQNVFVVWNPFNTELAGQLRAALKDKALRVALASRRTIASAFNLETTGVSEDASAVPHIAQNVIEKAVIEKASDIHIEPKEEHVLIRFRVDGDMRQIQELPKDLGLKLVSRLKVLGGLDIAERRRSQDGSMKTLAGDREYKLRLATTSTPHGESMIIRLLDPNVKPKALQELGMTKDQEKEMALFAARDRGLLLIVGPTGSGKTTTIYSLFAHVDCKTRSLISVEDPVEYAIPHANQQQVNEKAGVTFETLLKSSVRQDPDILFLGEMRDPFSAKTSMDFASTGHLTVSTLHTSNATTAIFRLERLALGREIIADTLLGVVAQRLLKKLCVHCKKAEPITQEEKEILSAFTQKIPDEVAHPIGCDKCHGTGYAGREGLYEIIKFDAAVSRMVRSQAPISEIRSFLRKRGDYLIADHAIDKVREHVFSVKDIYEKVLVEEISMDETKEEVESPRSEAAVPVDRPAQEKQTRTPTVLIVEDDKDSASLISHLLGKKGYDVTVARDGVDALFQIGHKRFGLILSDVDMPNLDGFKLVEMLNQKDVKTPVLFLTGRTSSEDETKGLELGAADYIKKPIQKDVLWARVERAFARF